MSCSPRNYTLIIAEKPKAARKIVDAFSSKFITCKSNSVLYWVIPSRNIVIASAVGHLFNLTGPSGFPIFEVEWKPLWEIDKKSYYTRKYLILLQRLCKYAKEYINACDYDIEGSVIGYMIIKNFGDLKKAKRMKFSSLTKEELIKSFNNLQPLDYNMVNAGIARHVVDWLWGINVSRALMSAVKDVSNKSVILSAGRVQSPTLIEVVKRHLDRETFVPLPYFKIELKIRLGNIINTVYLDQEFHNIDDVESLITRLKKDKLIIDKNILNKDKIARPPPFNLGDLQLEAGRLFGLSPYRTERIGEELYLEGVISYPRTNSQKIPPTVNINDIVTGLSQRFGKLVDELNLMTKGKFIVRQGNKDDPAHPAIYPTGIIPKKLGKQESEVYELIVRRFLASISRDAEVTKQRIILKFEKEKLKLQLDFQKITYEGWLKIYPYHRFENEELVNVEEGSEVEVISIKPRLLLTKPSTRFTRVSLLKWMEDVKIGTEATRGKIIETLFQRKYVVTRGSYIHPTKLGIIVSEVLEKYFNELTNVKMTADMEDKLDEIIYGKKNKDEVINEVKDKISKYFEKYNEEKKIIGLELAKGLNLVKYNKCKLCDFEAIKDGLCKYHLIAKEKLNEAIKIWKDRTGYDIKTILKYIRGSKSTGKLISDLMSI
ncbi:DNA topoisomerase I [Acidianus infernus]|uniref:DNA topoisomerase I n=1 Tax=Acidianus infernus TaxID=12915 RepID=UPI003592F617